MPGTVTDCSICGNTDFRLVLDLGHTPPAARFLPAAQRLEPERFYPLKTVICTDCKLVQLNYVIPRETLFHSEYTYDMSVTDAGADHFYTMAETITADYPEHNTVVDIGSNTGVLLDGFAEQGWDVLGVEPARNVYDIAVSRGIPTMNTFFDQETAETIRRQYGPRDMITATNVLAHIEELHDAVTGVKTLLADDGVFVCEVPYFVDLIENNEFDTISHEHLFYFSLTPLIRLFDEFDMDIIDIEKQAIHGGSIRVHVAHRDVREPTEAVERFRRHEEDIGIHTEETLNAFRNRVEQNRRELVRLVHELVAEGHTVAGIGAPAKGVTLLNYCGFDRRIVPYVAEKAELKIGTYVPGTHNAVVSDEEFFEKQPEYALLLPWNFADSLMDRFEPYQEAGGTFIIPVPELHTV